MIINILAFLALSIILPVYANEPEETLATARELYTCKDEAKRFGSWASIAGQIDISEVVGNLPGVQLAQVRVGDGRIIRGIVSTGKTPNTNAILVIGGNGWSAKPFAGSVLPHMMKFDTDIYYFDYRGYGLSKPGLPTMHAILEDYRDIGNWLKSKQYDHLYLYAFSFGGVVALGAFPELRPFERIVIDSAPSRASDFGFSCFPTYETVDFLRPDCAKLTVMHGTSDWVMPRPKVDELIGRANTCGATIDSDANRGHPFQIEWESSRIARIESVMRHLKIDRSQ